VGSVSLAESVPATDFHFLVASRRGLPGDGPLLGRELRQARPDAKATFEKSAPNHLRGVLARDYAETVMFDFIQPQQPARRRASLGGQAGRKPGEAV
jgi:hypothetical protein